MRAMVVAGILVALALSGCIGTGNGMDDGDNADSGDGTGGEPGMPGRFFEPNVVLETERYEVAKGSDPEVSFYVTDMHDYPFPVTFIDWALFHDRNPNPVAEGDATVLPGTFNQTLFAEDYHMYGFHVDDTQGLKETRIIIIEVGEPEGPGPNVTEIQEFVTRIEEYFVEQVEEEVVEEVEEETYDGLPPIVRSWKSWVPETCKGCQFGAPGGPGADGCEGWIGGVNGVDCSWVDLNPGAAGNLVTFYTEWTPGNEQNLGYGAPVLEFFDSCDSETATQIGPTLNPGLGSVIEEIIPAGARCMVGNEGLEAAGGITFYFDWEETAGPFGGIKQTFTLFESASCAGGPGPGSCSPANCRGMDAGWNGDGCVWVALPPNAVGKAFLVSSGVDMTVVAADKCDPEGVVLYSQDTGQNEAGTIGEGWGCLMGLSWLTNGDAVTLSVAE